ncbi:MAG TPA: type II toxin-antitoxin system MqsA family antitoxin [Chloroflexota bacterium]|nr:type II toxin-antitoxin system MqsA family antitoxin [Chloroflexota bacterium]
MTDNHEVAACAVCGKPGARVRRVARTYGSGDELLVIENVPVVTCPSYGESYLTADTLREIEGINQERKSVAVERPVDVAAFAAS